MPFTFSAGSFSFLKSSTTSQSIIEQNNNVDTVNKNIINVNDNSDTSDTGNNELVIPLERSRSLDRPISLRNNRRNSNSSNNTNNLKNINRKAWYKSLFFRIHQTFSPSRWNDDNNSIIKIINNNNENNRRLEYSKDENNVDNNNNRDNRDESGCDDGPIMMKSRQIVRRGNNHDFYVTTKNDDYLKNKNSRNSGLSSSAFDGVRSSVFEKCAQTPRHFAKETEVLGKVGRFTIVREREDFDTTYFDQCHCQQKPCRFSTSGCSGSHPVLPPESLPQIFKVHSQNHIQTAALQSNKHHSWSSSKSRQSIYCNPTSFPNSSRFSLPSLQNGACQASNVGLKASIASNSTSCRGPLSQSASSPNLVHLNQRLKNENVNKNTAPKNNNVRSNSANIVVGGNVSKYPNPPTNGITISAMKRSKKPSLVNIKSLDSVTPISTNQPLTNSSSTLPVSPPTPTYPSKFSHHNPNEPHTTINSHSGRKFEVEWSSNYSTTTRSSSSTSSSSSSSSSDPFPSPSSTISSVFSMASSPDKSVTTLSRRCSTLSSKCGRKFEVTIITSNGNNSNNLVNVSPHSTIITSSVDESTATNTETSKC